MGLPAVSTPLSEPPDFDEHVCIDFVGLSKGQRRNKSQELRDLAMEARLALQGPAMMVLRF